MRGRPAGWLLGAAVAGALLAWALWPERPRPVVAVETPAPPGPYSTPAIARATAGSSPSPDERPAASPPRPPVSPVEPPRSGGESQATPAATVDWERIPLDRTAGESLGDLETRKAFSRGVAEKRVISRCVDPWEKPPGIDRIEMQLELRVRSVGDALVVEDAVILESNPGSAELERCVLAGYRGLRITTPGAPPGPAYRLRWSGSVSLR